MLSTLSRSTITKLSSHTVHGIRKSSDVTIPNPSQVQNTKVDYSIFVSSIVASVGAFSYLGYEAYTQPKSAFDPDNNYIIIL
jgi:hypothetical protein